MYYNYWHLNKAPFDNVPDPSMYVDCHPSMENAIAETLFAIEEGDECLAVIVGDVGLGKTLSIRMIIDALDQDRYRIALITNPGISFVQVLQEILGQLTGRQCSEKRKVNLLESFNTILFSTLAENRKVLIIIDEANAIAPANLESLRLLTNMQEDNRNLFTMVLAGQMEFARRLEHPKRANLFQRVGAYNRIERLESLELVQKFVETRLQLAGGTRRIFTDDAYEQILAHSHQGIPRLINKIAKLCLKAGETNGFDQINGDVVAQIASRFGTLPAPAAPKRKSRIRQTAELAGEGEVGTSDAHMPIPSGAEMNMPPMDEVRAASPLFSALPAPAEEGDNGCIPADMVHTGIDAEPDERFCTRQQVGEAPLQLEYFSARIADRDEPAARDVVEEMQVGELKIKIDFPEQLITQTLSSSPEHRFRLAGMVAAETLKKYPQLTKTYFDDPVPIWQEIRDFVMDRFNHAA